MNSIPQETGDEVPSNDKEDRPMNNRAIITSRLGVGD
jgi:hypothetical protein